MGPATYPRPLPPPESQSGRSLRQMTELRRHTTQNICCVLGLQSFEVIDNLTPTLLAGIIASAIEEALRGE